MERLRLRRRWDAFPFTFPHIDPGLLPLRVHRADKPRHCSAQYLQRCLRLAAHELQGPTPPAPKIQAKTHRHSSELLVGETVRRD